MNAVKSFTVEHVVNLDHDAIVVRITIEPTRTLRQSNDCKSWHGIYRDQIGFLMLETDTSVELTIKFVIIIHIGISLNYDDAANSLFGVKLFSNADYDDIKVNSSLLDNFAFSDEDAKAFVNRLLKNSTFNS